MLVFPCIDFLVQYKHRRKDEDLRVKDEDLRSFIKKNDKLLDQVHNKLMPCVAQLRSQQFKLYRYKCIVDCRGALELVDTQNKLGHAGNKEGWRRKLP